MLRSLVFCVAAFVFGGCNAGPSPELLAELGKIKDENGKLVKEVKRLQEDLQRIKHDVDENREELEKINDIADKLGSMDSLIQGFDISKLKSSGLGDLLMNLIPPGDALSEENGSDSE